MVSGGAGALVWMWISACFGLSSKFSECMLAIKYREVNEKGEMSGGPMYTMKKGLKNKKLGAVLGWLFALFAVIASFGIGNMTQGNSIATSVHATFGVSVTMVGVVITVLALLIIIGGIKTISKVSSVVVPVMAIFYVVAGIIVILGNIHNLPAGISMIFKMAFSVKAVGGALCGNIVASMMNAARYGVARGCFSNEAGMGSAAITAAAATTDNPVRHAYINMTGTFCDTIEMCIRDRYKCPSLNKMYGEPEIKRRTCIVLLLIKASRAVISPYTIIAVSGSKKLESREVAISAAIEPIVIPLI